MPDEHDDRSIAQGDDQQIPKSAIELIEEIPDIDPNLSELMGQLTELANSEDVDADQFAQILDADLATLTAADAGEICVALIERLRNPLRVVVLRALGQTFSLCTQTDNVIASARLETYIAQKSVNFQIRAQTSILTQGGTIGAGPKLQALFDRLYHEIMDQRSLALNLRLLARAATLAGLHRLALDCLRLLKPLDPDNLAKIEHDIDHQIGFDPVLTDHDLLLDADKILTKMQDVGDIINSTGTLEIYPVETLAEVCKRNDWRVAELEPTGTKISVGPIFHPDTQQRHQKEITHAAASLAELKKAKVFGGSFLTICDEIALVAPMSFGSAKRWRLNSPPILSANENAVMVRVPDKALTFDTALHFLFAAQANYFHLVFERVSSLLVLSDWTPPPGCVLLVDAATYAIPQFARLLDLVNKWDLEIVALKPGECAYIDNLVLPEPCGWTARHMKSEFEFGPEDSYILPQAVEAIRDSCSQYFSKDTANRRLLIARGTAKNSRLSNSQEVQDMLVDQFGFEVFDPAAYSLEEQITTFSSATVVVGASGSGLVGSLFMPKGALFVPLLRPDTTFAAWGQLGHAAGLKTIHIAGRNKIVIDPAFPNHGRFTVPLNDLKSLLKRNL